MKHSGWFIGRLKLSKWALYVALPGQQNVSSSRSTWAHLFSAWLASSLVLSVLTGRYKLRGALVQAEQREAQLRATEHGILMEVVKNHSDAEASLLNMQASENLYAAAQATVETVQRKFDNGSSDIIGVLSAQRSLSDAQEQRMQSLSELRSMQLTFMNPRRRPE